MRIAMIGAGYVGLVSSACFSEFGWNVVCVDSNEARITQLRSGAMPIYEPGLAALVDGNVRAGRLSFSSELGAAVAEAEAVFIAVGTPSRRGDGHADLSHVFSAAGKIAQALDGYTAVVTKSTVPVGTGREVGRVIRQARADAQFDVVSNPEFLREGSAINDFMRPDRVVIGAESERARDVMRALYRPLHLNEAPIIFTTLETSELIKYAANSFLAAKVTFVNEFAELCERVDADVQDVARAVGLDGRIGSKFLHAGPGFGGSCFPKDVRAIINTGRKFGARLSILEAVNVSNEMRKSAMADKIIAACGGSVAGKTIAVLGVTFKPNTDDMREAPSLAIIPALQSVGASVRAFDPAGMGEARSLLDDVGWGADAYDIMDGADALVIITEWNEFRALDLERVHDLLASPVIIDLRNIYRPAELAAAGFFYHSIGRASAAPRDASSQARIVQS